MKPHVLLIEPMMPRWKRSSMPPICRHRLFAAQDRAALVFGIGSSVRVAASLQRRRVSLKPRRESPLSIADSCRRG